MMKPITESTRMLTEDTSITVKTYRDGTRTVCKEYGNGESWWRYVIIPRAILLAAVKANKEVGLGHINRSWWDLIPNQFVGWAHDGGPGCPFATATHKWRSNRRWIVLTQHGGWDI
jgi:hypothetical protein